MKTMNVKVKPLEWKGVNEGFGLGRTYYGSGAFDHEYGVRKNAKGKWFCFHHVGIKVVHLPDSDSKEEAKAAAQADYEARILSALELPDEVSNG